MVSEDPTISQSSNEKMETKPLAPNEASLACERNPLDETEREVATGDRQAVYRPSAGSNYKNVLNLHPSATLR